MRKIIPSVLIMICAVALFYFTDTKFKAAEEQVTGVIDPDSWVAVDGLGRTLSTYGDVGDAREKYVGIFYWTWHYGQSQGKSKAYNVTNIINQYPEATNDWDHPVWEGGSGTPHHWDEPLFGYYINTDKYVVRKHAELLADAGVDVVIFDCTNGTMTWETAYETLFEVFEQAKQDGVDVPQVAFMLNFAGNTNTLKELTQLYEDIYAPGRYQDLWFYWDGKPLIMAHKNALFELVPEEAEILDFFTFRMNIASYFTYETPIEDEQWGWCSVYPQGKYGVREDGTVEQMTVNVAQNASEHGLVAMNDYRGGVFGRAYSNDKDGKYSYSYTYKGEEVVVTSDMENAYWYGVNFQQQWDYALEVDPDFIFVTGWNEWIAGRWDVWQGTTNAFPDQYNAEYSRDAEPSKGVLKDYYYYQLVENIRRYKGIEKPEYGTKDKNVKQTIDINGDVSQWDDVLLEYNHYTGSTQVRDYKGWGSDNWYTSDTMRNDIVQTKVAYDSDNIYFMVKTVDDITDPSEPGWMRLFIDTEFSGVADNWEGFEYVINRVSPEGNKVIIEKSTGGWAFKQCGTGEFSVQGNCLQISVPRNALGMSNWGKVDNFNFKWADNTLPDGVTEDTGDILDFYQYGDVAPGGRFMFSFRTTEELSPTERLYRNIITIVIVVAILMLIAVISLIIVKKRKKVMLKES